MRAYSSDLFKELREGLTSSLDKVQETIENCLNKTKSEMKSFVEQMKAIAKSAKFDIPIVNNEQSMQPMQSTSQKVDSIRGPPQAKIKMPTIDLSNDQNAINSEISIVNERIEIQKQKLKELQEQYQNLDKSIAERNESKEYLEALRQQINSINKELSSFNKKGIEIRLKNLDRIEYLKSQLSDAAAEAKQLEKQLSSKQSIGLESSAYSLNEKMLKLKGSIANNEIRVDALNKKLSSLRISKFSILKKSIDDLYPTLGKVLSGLGKFGNGIKTVSSKAISGFKSILNTIKKVGNEFGMVKKKLLQLTNMFKGASNSTNGYRQSLGSLVRSFTIFSLIFPLVSQGIRALGTYLLSTLRTNSQFVNSLNQIKSNLQTAFTPIFNAILPAINALMSAIAKATAYLSAFISAIFGKSLSQTKKATSGIIGARDALDSTGKSAKKTSNAIKEATRSLMGFDAINKLDSNKDSGSDSGVTGGSYTPSDIDTSTDSSFAKKLRDMWKKGDYKGIGKVIGEQINKAVLSFTNYISWDRVGAKITKFINAFCDMFNSLIDTINWENIGKMFGAGINTLANTLYRLINGINWDRIGKAMAQGINGLVRSVNWNLLGSTIGSYLQSKINMLYGFVTTVDWAGIGKSLADGIMGLVNSIDWGKAGETLTGGVRGLFSSLRNFISGLDWKQLGKDVWNFLSSIDWAGIVRDVANIIGQAIAGIGTFLWGFIEDTVISIRDYWAKQFEDCGGHIILGLLKGIGEAIAGIGTWIKENIFDPFISGFKSIFGIHSPSTVMMEMGTYLMQGLINGIKSIPILGTVIDVVGSGINWIGEQYNNIKEKGAELFENLKNGIVNNPIVQTVSSKINDGINWIGNQYTRFKNKGKELFDNVKKGISNNPIVQTVGNVVNNGVSAIKSKASSFLSRGKDLMSNLKNGINQMKTSVTNTVSSVVSGISSKISSASKSAVSWGKDMMNGLAKGINSAKNAVVNGVKGLANKISSFLHFSRPDEGPLREYETWMPDFMHGLKDGIERNKSSLLGSVKSISNEMASSFNSLQQPEIAFAGSQDVTITHVIEDKTKENDLKAILDELKNLKEYFEMIKDAIDDKELNTYLDGEKMYKKFVDKHNKNARRKGKSDLDI